MLVALTLALSACGSSTLVDASALPNANARVIGVAIDANVTEPADLPVFDDTNGVSLVPDGGRYKIGARKGQSVVTAALADDVPVDQVVTATFDSTPAPVDAGFGVMCRVRDADNYYRLGVANDGTYAIQRVKDGKSTVLTGGGLWREDKRIRKTPGAFTVRGECVGRTLKLFESDNEIVSAQDSSIQGRKVGVFVESFAEPNAAVQVDGLSVRAFANRNRVSPATAKAWEEFFQAQEVSNRCDLLDPKAAPGKHTKFVARCGAAIFVQVDRPEPAAREFARMLGAVGPSLENVSGLPDCPKQTGIRGPLPPPRGSADDARIGRVACIDLGNATVAIWLHEAEGLIGFTEVRRADRAVWKGYGRDWPPFAYHAPTG
jgi:hypothetical protein